MRTYGLIGYPLSHSFSKSFFNRKFEAEDIGDAEYLNFPLSFIEELPKLLADHPGLMGLNVTIPYKEKVLEYLDEMDEIAAAIRACNCIRIKEGRLSGFNTDVAGFEQSLDQQLQPCHRKALVLGSGGAAKAVEYVLKKKGIEFLVVSRNPAGSGAIGYEQLDASLMASHLLIINTTPSGMFPNVEAYPNIPYSAITPKHYLFDLVYNPDKTRFLEKGAEHGATIQNGLPMLIKQAEESWRIWNE